MGRAGRKPAIILARPIAMPEPPDIPVYVESLAARLCDSR
jgi:hypothetical protein